jgi:hypothetical protein
MAEGMRFELTVGLDTLQRFSKPPPSATRPPLRLHALLRGRATPVKPRHHPFPSAQGDREAALHARTGHQLLVPALHVRKVGQIDLMALVAPGPAQDREVRDR